jgi:1,4-dihydroxy-2-naphthoyl-CoA hydrolase
MADTSAPLPLSAIPGMTSEHLGGTLSERMGMEFLEIGAQRTVARIPVQGNTQPYGLLHGGASAALAESVGSVAAAVHAGADRIAVGVDLSATHHRAVREGWVTGVATPLSLGRSVASYEIVVRDDQGGRVCTARLTCMLRDRAPGA